MRSAVRECAAGRVLPRPEINAVAGETPLEYSTFRDDWRKRRISRAFSKGINSEKIPIAVSIPMIAAIGGSSATIVRPAESIG
jgi:hypothetical protein